MSFQPVLQNIILPTPVSDLEIQTKVQNMKPPGSSPSGFPTDVAGCDMSSPEPGIIGSFVASSTDTWLSTPAELLYDDLELQSPIFDSLIELQGSNYLSHRTGDARASTLDHCEARPALLPTVSPCAMTDVISSWDFETVPGELYSDIMQTTETSHDGFPNFSPVVDFDYFESYMPPTQDRFQDQEICFPRFDFLPDWTLAGQLQHEELYSPDEIDEDSGALTEDSRSWICRVDGCHKRFDQRHKYNKHIQSHSRHHFCSVTDCGYRAYLVKDLKRHISGVHKKAKFPCPVKDCIYAKDGSKGGISRKDALKRHLQKHRIPQAGHRSNSI